MAINNDRNLLEQQILSNSGLKGKELENLKARLATLSEQQLQAELSKSLSGNNKGEWYTGVMLEHNESVIMRNNHEQTTYTDDSGNEISELKDGDEVLERTIKSTDDKGNVFETTVTFSGGKPLTQIKSKNGNTTETTTYKYNDDADVPFVTVETKKADQSKVMTNVLEIDENGNFDNEDFIDRQTTSMDGTTTHIFTENNCVIEQQVKPNGKKIDTIYKGDGIEDYDNKKLHRVYQRTELKGEVHEVAYDGNGNTRTVVQNGESPSAIAKKFGVKESSLRRLNPARGKNAITQVGADIVVPGEYNADARVMTRRKSKQGAMQDFANDEVQRTAERLYSSTMQEVTLDKDYKDAYSYARTLLAADGVKNPSNQQINNKANEILVANGNIKFKKGTKIQITAKAPDSKFVQDLSNNGFKPTRENAIFYNRFNALNPSQQQNILSVIKYCRSQKITDPNKIKARILETFPEINLFDSGKVIPMNSSFGTPAFQRKNPVALETFLTETLKLDLKSETGAMVYEKLSSLPQEALNKINAQNFVDLSKANFVEIAHRLEANGIDIRSRQEHQIENNSPRMKAEQEKRELRESASQNIALAYDNAINIIKQYQGNQGWINVGYWREKLGKQIDIKGVNTCFEQVIKQFEKEKQFAVGYLKGKSANDKEFKEAFKKVTGGAEYNEANMKAFLAVAQDPKADFNDEKYNEKFWNAYNKVFGVAKKDSNGKMTYEPKIVKEATSRTNYQQYADGAGDIVLMLLGTEAIGKGVAWAGGKLISKVSPYVPKFLANAGSKTVMTIGSNNITVGRVAANMASQSASFTLWDASKNYINLKTKDIQYSGEAAEKEWEAYKEGNVESAKFGAFAGALNTTVVGKVINGTMKMFEKPIAKAVSKVGKSFETTSAMTGADVMKTFMLNQTPGMLAKTAGTIAEIGGFTLYETANEVVEELLKKGEDGHLPAELTENGLTSYLLDKLGGQAKNLGEIKAISRLMFMHKGAIKEQARLMDENLAKCETLKNVQIKKTEVNGREIFEVTLSDGNRKVANSVEEVIANCNVLMQLDVISNAAKENETEDKKTTPQGMNAEEDALIQKARRENPATVVEEKVRRQWQQSDLETPVPEVKVDLFNLDPNAGLKEPVQNVENEVTSLIFKGKLNETLTQRYNEMGKVFTEIAQRRSADIKELAKANPKDKQAVADGIVKILAQELGMEGFEPPIVFENTNGGDGFADWPNGRIVINKEITNVKKLTSMISHEFVHMLQYRDILAQYGEQGLRDLIANDKSIPEDKKESYIKDALENNYNKHLLQSYNFQRADYLRRIYKDEFTNTVGTEDMPRYVDRASERGAYSSQEKVDRGLDESNLGELSVGEYVPNDASLAALRAKMKAKLQAGQDVTSNNSLNRTSEHTEDIEINSDGTVTRKGVPAGISDSELTEVAPFARRLVNSEQTLINEKVIRDIEQTLTKRMIDKTSEEEKLQIKSIVNKITPKNLELIEIMTADKDISNELILNILDSCNKPYKISMLGLFNPVNIPIFLLQNSGFIGDIKLNDNLKRDYAKRLLTNKNVSKESIPVILQNMEKGNSKLVDKALNNKNFDFNTLSAILRNTLYDNSLYVNGQKSVSNSRVKFAESLIDNPNFPNDCISDVVWWYGIENVNNKFLENLCNNKDFPPQQIETLIRNICSNRKGNSYMFNTSEPKFKQKLAERLIEDNNCPNEYVADIIGSIEKRQEVLFEQIYADKNIPKSEISSILYLDYGLSKGIEKLDLPNKIAILSNSVSVSDLTLTYLKKYNIDKIKIDELVNKISMEMGLKKENIQTSEIYKQSLFKNYISNNSNIEETINNIDLNKYPHGIPMKYSRIQFTKDIHNLLSNLSTEDKVAVQSYFSINIENGKLEGFPIIPEQTKIIKKELLPVIEKIKEKIIDFTQKNETTINDPELKKILDSIIQGCPEFATIIGKTQHGTHQYTVDVHTLKVLQNIFRDPEYKNLDDESKTVLKFSVLLHDIGKKEGVIDKTHYETSAKYAVSILEKYKLSPREKSRIIETIYNHHWFEQYNKNEINANLVNAIFRTPKDLQLGMLMAKADLAGVSDDFHYKITKTHNQTDFNEYFDKKRDELFVQQNARYKNLNLVMDTKFSQTDTRKFPTEKVSIKGKDIEIPVLNLTDEALPNDLYKYGFSKGVTRNNAKFLAHFNDRIKGLKVFMALSSSPTTESVQSLSMISLNNSRAFKNQIYGVITDIDMANVAQASNTNISSGYKKDLKNFAKDLYGFWQVNTYVRDNFINELDKAGISLTKEEYVELAKQLVNIQYSTQINKDIKIGNKTIPAELLQSALNESRDRLFDGDLHSEIVAINPRVKALVARVSSINECSIEFLELATENNLPIILIGHNEHGKIY